MDGSRDLELARAIAQDIARLGGRAYFVGGIVRDGLMGVGCKMCIRDSRRRRAARR